MPYQASRISGASVLGEAAGGRLLGGRGGGGRPRVCGRAGPDGATIVTTTTTRLLNSPQAGPHLNTRSVVLRRLTRVFFYLRESPRAKHTALPFLHTGDRLCAVWQPALSGVEWHPDVNWWRTHGAGSGIRTSI